MTSLRVGNRPELAFLLYLTHSLPDRLTHGNCRILPILLLALLFDAVIGDPERFIRGAPSGDDIWLPSIFRQSFKPPRAVWHFRKFLGTLVLMALLFIVLIGHWLTAFVFGLPFGWILLALIMSVLLAQKNLYRMWLPLRQVAVSGRPAAQAVAHIVGRDTGGWTNLPSAGLPLSLSRNLSDGVVAPVFWGALFGLPGCSPIRCSTRRTA